MVGHVNPAPELPLPALTNRATALVSVRHRKMLSLGAERLLAFGLYFSQIELRQRWFAPILARYYPPKRAAPVFAFKTQAWS